MLADPSMGRQLLLCRKFLTPNGKKVRTPFLQGLFQMSGWIVDRLLVFLALSAIRTAIRARALFWPVVDARSASSIYERRTFGCSMARVDYVYWIDERQYRGEHCEPFLRHYRGFWWTRRY